MGPVVLEKIKKTILNETFKDSETLLKAENIGPGGLLSPYELNTVKKGHDSEIFGPIAFIQLADSSESTQIGKRKQLGLSCVYSKSNDRLTTPKPSIPASLTGTHQQQVHPV